MLDSSPVALPSMPRPLKRSASTASLPTPPRTHYKHAKRRDYDTESSNSEEEETVDRESRHSHKRRRASTNKTDDTEEEEAFWMSKSDGDCPDTDPFIPTTTASSSTLSSSPAQQPPALLYRRHRLTATASSSSVGAAPVSPPPSNRKRLATSSTISSAPVTPERKKRRGFPVRDSPNNPFLLSPDATPADDSASPSPDPSPHTPLQERPTVTYVFRGVRGTFPNPLYDHERGRPRTPSARSKLPVEHPDFSPDPSCPPKLLFPAAPRKSRRTQERTSNTQMMERAAGVSPPGVKTTKREHMMTAGRKTGMSKFGHVSGSDDEADDGEEDEEEEEIEMIKPTKLDFKAEVQG